MIGKKINQLATELAPTTTDLTIIGDPISGVSKKITLEQLGAIFGGAVSFYTTLGDFPATGVIDIIYCAKDTKKLYLWSGSAYVEVFPSQSLLDTYQLRSEKGVSNGYASLDVNGKVPIGQLPNSIMEYKGTWSAATNTPTLANGTGDTGDVYICNVAGTVNFGAGPLTFAVGDYVVYSGTIWQRSSGAVGTVTSVAASITGDAIGITGSPVTTSGTLAFAFGGNSTQYINGAGNLVTFPGVINEAQNLITEVYNKTGATLTKGTVVYINGGQGNLPSVTKALATGDSTSAQTYGIVQADITNMNNGFVVVAGRLTDIDTQAYTNGTQLYLSSTTAGAYTSTKQYAPAHLVYIGIIVRSHPTQGVIEVKIQNGYELDELHNVAAQSPSNGDILQYVSSTSLWTKVAGTTSNIAEGSNLYYTDARSRAALSFTAGSGAYNSTTGVITIPTNTNQLTNGANYITLASLSAGAGISYNNTTGVIASTITQYTDALARAAISLTTTGTSGAATYNSTTGVLNVPQYAPDLSGYVPTSRTLTINGTAFDLSANRSWSVGTVTSVGLSSATSGVTIGSTPITTSGTITLAIATASGSQQGLLSSTDWTTFNNKQNALTNPVTGTGTTNYLPKFTGASTIGNSVIQEASGNIGIGVSPTTTLDVNGTGRFGASATKLTTYSDSTYSGIFNGASLGSNESVYMGDGQMFFITSGSLKMRLTASGNLGLGVSPSAWVSTWRAIQLAGGSLYTNAGGTTGQIALGQNWYYDGTNNIYINSAAASDYYQFGGSHVWRNAPSGTAGNAISFTQAMTLDASGRLIVGATSPIYLKFNVAETSTNRVAILYRGTQGADTNMVTTFGTPYLSIGGQENKVDSIQTIGFGFTNGTTYIQPAEIGFQTTSLSGYTLGDLVFATRSATTNTAPDVRLRIASTGAATFNGNVGIGVSPLTKLHLQGSSANYILLTNTAADGVANAIQGGIIGQSRGYANNLAQMASILFRNENSAAWYRGEITFNTNGTDGTDPSITPTERMRITNGGQVYLNTTSLRGTGYQTGQAGQFGAEFTNYGGAQWFTNVTNDEGTYLVLGKSRGTTVNSNTIVQNGDSLGALIFQGTDGSSTQNAAMIRANVDGTPGAGDMPGRLAFFTTADGSASLSERMRITSGGNVEINTGSIKTGEPDTGFGRAAFKIGSRQSGAAFGVGGYIPISIDGTVYYINLNTSTP